MSIPSTTSRVASHTSDELNARIKAQTDRNIAYYAAHPEKIDQRMQELNREWDIERTLETSAASISIASIVLGVINSRKWLIMPGIVGGFLLQHAVQGWCPPLPVFRRLGVRTQTEIERERYALKALRGDFNGLQEAKEQSNVIKLSQRVLDAVK